MSTESIYPIVSFNNADPVDRKVYAKVLQQADYLPIHVAQAVQHLGKHGETIEVLTSERMDVFKIIKPAEGRCAPRLQRIRSVDR